MRWVLFVTLALVALVGVQSATAQTVAIDPTTVEFTPSADHSAVHPLTGVPVLTNYVLRFYAEGASQPVQEQDLGKPTPVNGVIRIVNRALFTGTPIALDTRYVARVAAKGPAGEGVSDPSGPFGNASPLRSPSVPSAPLLR